MRPPYSGGRPRHTVPASVCGPVGRTAVTGEQYSLTLPGGRVAMSVHRGGYEGLLSAHRAVVRWCAAQRQQLAGPRWEIYGHHRDDPAELETEVYHLLA